MILKNIYGPLVFCCDMETLSAFVKTVTLRFVHSQMPILNNISHERLLRMLNENINYVSKFPAVDMLRLLPNPSPAYMDARDLFDILKRGHSGHLTNIRPIHHVTNEANFLDTWRTNWCIFIRLKSKNSHSHFLWRGTLSAWQ